MTWRAPLKDMRFALTHLAGLEDHAPVDIIDAVLEEAAKVSQNLWAPTNRIGDTATSQFTDGAITTPDGFKEAYDAFAQGGWGGLTAAEKYGGQELPESLSMAVNEMWQAANLSLSLCPLLTTAAIEAIVHHGSDQQKELYLPKLVSGEWTGTMHLTEPQAGTDLAAIRTTATKTGDHYLIKGQKIFITWGENDFTPNIIHLVLAHIDGLPEGNDGLGLFIVPKFLVGDDGSIGDRNDVKAVSVEHKLGIHGSPTCVMMYGEQDSAIGYLVGEEGKGLRNMFTMMNNARIGVGLQGVAVAEAASQHAATYARERVQSPALGGDPDKRVTIINHADVRRMLLTMKATTEATRALTYYAGGMIDKMNGGDAEAAKRVDLLTPLVKAWGTDMAVETASLGVQVHGGMGFIEETGAAQYYRDARILPIYEGTNGIQSMDLVFRKVLRDSGAEAKRFLGEIKSFADNNPGDMADKLVRAIDAVTITTDWVLGQGKNLETAAAAAQPYQRQFSVLAGGYMMAQLFKAVEDADNDDYTKTKRVTTQFFIDNILPQVHGLSDIITANHEGILNLEESLF